MIHVIVAIAGIVVAVLVASIVSWRLRPALFTSKAKLPAILLGNHEDWWPFLRWVPRRLTAFIGGRDPVQLLGTNPRDHHQDVPAAGTWCLSWPFHAAALIKTRLFGFGIRRDYVDGYWTLRAVLRKA